MLLVIVLINSDDSILSKVTGSFDFDTKYIVDDIHIS